MIAALLLIHARIVQSLDNAMENGYMLNDWEAEDIAADLHDYDADFEDAEGSALIPFIAAWLEGDGE